MKRIVLVIVGVLILGACEDATQPVGVDEPSAQLSEVSDAACVTPPSGLVSWWPGDGHVFDIVDVNHGIPFEDATFAPGMVGEAFSFDGVEDWVLAPTANSIEELQELTIDAWVKHNSLPSGQMEHYVWLTGQKAVLRHDGENGPRQLHFFMTIDDVLRHIRVNNVLEVGVFHHVAGTYDGSFMRLYLDGVEIGSLPVSGTVGAAVAVELGVDLDGLVDEVEVYDRALSASEIKAIYDAGSAGKCKKTPTPPCPETVDVFVTDEERLLAALEAARPGDVIGLDGYFEVETTVEVEEDGLTLTCVTPGSGLFGEPGFTLLWVAASNVRVERLSFDGTEVTTAYFAEGDEPTFSDNTVTCGEGICVWFQGSEAPTITDNHFDVSGTSEAFSAIQIQRGTTHAHVEGNTVLGPIDEGRSGIRIRSGSNHMVIGNKVSGPWDESISAGGSSPSENQFIRNRLEGATEIGLELWGEVCDWIAWDIDTGEIEDECHEFEPATDNVVRNNRISGAGEAGIRVESACWNTFVGNNLQGNADDIGIRFDGVETLDFFDPEEGLYFFGTDEGTGANVFVGNGNIVIDNGDLDCDGDGEPDPNIINGAGTVLHGVNLGQDVSEAMSSKKDADDLTLQ